MRIIKINKTAIVLSLLVVVTSCHKKLDVFPQNNITPEQIQTASDVEAVLFGCYSLLQSPNSFGERYFFAADLLADQGQINFIGTFAANRELANKNMVSSNGIASAMWTNGYTNINALNTVLDKLDVITDDTKRTEIEGEAKFIRGAVYYYLVNFFAQPWSAGNTSTNPGVPLTLEPVYAYDSLKHKPARSTVEQVYNQIIADFTDAAAMLPEEAVNARATRWAAEAFLARVYMAQGKYVEAATAADNVISSGYFQLGDYSAAFNNGENSEEDIFAIQQTSQSNAGTNNNGLPTFYAAQFTGRGDAQVPKSYYDDNFELGDERGEFWYEGVSLVGPEGFFTSKYAELYSVISVVRLAEMYLTRGEANYRSGGAPIGGVDPLDDINEVRARANASLLGSITSGDDFVEERFRELAFEGDRLWTLKRLQMPVDGLPYNDDMLVLPIPQREIDVNGNLDQNDGYN